MIVTLMPCALPGCRQTKPIGKPEALKTAGDQPIVRVLLLDDAVSCMFSCDAAVTVTTGDVQLAQISIERLEEPVSLNISDKKFTVAGWSCRTARLTLKPDPNAIFKLNNKPYRGELTLVLSEDGNSFDAVNHIAAEPYLAGVIGAEMPSYWEPEALKAQAIAARTYCMFICERFGKTRHWDMRKTAANQVYRGVAAESLAVWDAVTATMGQVLTCLQPGGEYEIFPCYYCSSCGGHTENSKNVFGDEYVTLGGVSCEYCRKIARRKMFYWPEYKLSKSEVSRRLIERYPQLKALEEISKIDVMSQSEYKELTRLTWLKLTGTTGKSDVLRGEDFRLAIDRSGTRIKSAAFKLNNSKGYWVFSDGRGFGHGVGLCQCGAEGQARKGKSTEQILEFYFPNSKIKKYTDIN